MTAVAVFVAAAIAPVTGQTQPRTHNWWQDNLFLERGSQAWFVVDPEDGKIPPMTAEARQRISARAEARKKSGRGPADSYEDRSLYDRCITRGLPGSMLPSIYGNQYQIVQAPGYVAISYEMIHETRVGWTMTVDDPKTWTRPWTFSLPLTADLNPLPLYECHEGNYGLKNILSAARAEEKAAN